MFKVNREKCIACTQCIKDCPTRVISLKDGKADINNEGCIKCAHCVAVCPVDAVSSDDYNMNEVKPYNKESFSIESENLLNFIKFRRSVRHFKNKPVEKEKLEQIIEAGRFTQTSTNSQDVSYTVVTDKLDELKELAYSSLKKKGEYILANLTPETEHLKRYANMWLHSYSEFKKDPIKNDRLFFNAPAVIFALGLGTFFSGFLLVASQDNKEILDLLEIKDGKQIISCLVIGYPDVKYHRTVPRKKANINWK